MASLALVSLCACALVLAAGHRAAGQGVHSFNIQPANPAAAEGGLPLELEGGAFAAHRAAEEGARTGPLGLGADSLPAHRAAEEEAGTGPVVARRELAAHLGAASASPPVKGAVYPEDAAALLKVAARWRKDILDPSGGYGEVDDRNLLATWNVTRPCSQWYGVTCNSASGRVTGLKLPALGDGGSYFFILGGPLPPELGALPELRSLVLAGNGFSFAPTQRAQDHLPWPFPKQWARLGKLSHLDLSGNSFGYVTGMNCCLRSRPIPQELCSLTSLTYLNLGLSGLGGSPLPSKLKQLSLIEFLDISNTFSGYIVDNLLGASDINILANLTGLTSLSLGQNGLTLSGLAAFSRLQGLQKLDLSFNPLGRLSTSSWLGALTGLVTLNMSNSVGEFDFDPPLSVSQLTGSIPSWLGGLTGLENLDLGFSQITGSIPSWLGGLQELRTLELGYSSIVGSIPALLGSLPMLSHLGLSTTALTGSIPASLFQPGRVLNLANNQLSGPLPASALELMAQFLAAAAKGSTINGSVDVSNNYLTGPCYSSLVASLKCPAKAKACSSRVTNQLGSLAGNCLQQCKKVPVGSFPAQRSSAACSAFCGADKASGPCNGHGTCSLEGRKQTPTCTCNEGFITPSSEPGTCVPAP